MTVTTTWYNITAYTDFTMIYSMIRKMDVIRNMKDITNITTTSSVRSCCRWIYVSCSSTILRIFSILILFYAQLTGMTEPIKMNRYNMRRLITNHINISGHADRTASANSPMIANSTYNWVLCSGLASTINVIFSFVCILTVTNATNQLIQVVKRTCSTNMNSMQNPIATRKKTTLIHGLSKNILPILSL